MGSTRSTPARPTRTLNPLPFTDLEPHRFEDLVRQLAYDLRPWRSLEAIGRGGADKGVDILGIEAGPELPTGIEEAEDDPESVVVEQRSWFFQCKREKAFSPQQVRRAVQDALDNNATPHGFVLAVASDVSRKARDVFREEMVNRGVKEFQLWAGGELEDMLFQARNDRLLFAYFGLSLQPRARTFGTTVRRNVALKKQLKALFEEEGEPEHAEFLVLRSPLDEYPPREGGRGPLVVAYSHLRQPGCLAVETSRHMAWVDVRGRRWDAIESVDILAHLATMELQQHGAWQDDPDAGPHRGIEHDFWSEYVPVGERGWVSTLRYVPLERIVGIDPIGDGYFPVPHLFVDFDAEHGAFRAGEQRRFREYGNHGGFAMRPETKLRAKLFPTPIPETLYPPPRGFEFVPSTKPTSLATDMQAKVASLVTPRSRQRAAAQEDAVRRPPNVSEANDEDRVAASAFRAWRDETALPVLQAFADHLKSLGHHAWLDSKDELAAEPFPAVIAVALECRIRAPTEGNPEYLARGHLRVWMDSSRPLGASIDALPGQGKSDGYSADLRRCTLTELSRARLEAELIGVLERIKQHQQQRI